MKKKGMRIIALFLSVLLVGTDVSMQRVYAMGNDSVTSEQEDVNQEIEPIMEDSEPVNDVSKSETVVPAAETESETVAPAAETESEAVAPAAETESEAVAPTAEMEPETDAATLLNYVFVEKSYVTAPDVQNIMANIGDDNTVLESAVLQYRNIDTGEMFENGATEIIGNSVLFTINHQEQQKVGYELVKMTYVIAGKEYSINFADAGMDMKYGVNKQLEVTPDDVVVTEEENAPEVAANIVTTDENGQSLSEQDIQQALENSEGATSTVEGVLNFAKKASNESLVVVLDPGHDSAHKGTQVNGYKEEDLVLKIAQYCKAELEKYNGVTVYMTREGQGCPNGGGSVNSTTCNAKRVEFAASKHADVYISFHLNSNDNPNANGAGVYYPNANYRPDLGQEGKELAQKIFEELNAVGLSAWAGGTLIRNSADGTTYPDGSLADYLGVIRRCKEAGIPAILIEHAFQSSPNDINNFLNSDEKLKKLGVADARGIVKYYGLTQNSEAVYNGVNYSEVYDYNYYLEHNIDLKAIFEGHPEAALQHFVMYGMDEGRVAREDFNPTTYKNRYKDLRQAYGNCMGFYYLHYMKYGKAEGRDGSGTAALTDYITTYNGVDYSAVYDYAYYTKANPDVVAVFGEDDLAIIQHFVMYGMDEGRVAKESFNPITYKNRYKDLRQAYGNCMGFYYLHYMKYGKAEGRDGSGTAALTDYITTYDGVDYSAVYDYAYYTKANPDVAAFYGEDDLAIIQHFVTYGMREGRKAKADFQVQSYYNRYKDLRRAFGNDLKAYYLHYMNNGQREGRVATGVDSMQDYETVYNGVDYSAVYDYNYYVNKYNDVKKTFGADDVAMLQHFATYGINEGRQASQEFNVYYYRENYIDLASVFGNDLKSYYIHYIEHGKAENRTASEKLYYSIMGTTATNLRQMVAYYNSKAAYPEFYKNTDAPTIEAFCQIYLEECATEGVKAEVAFCQAMKETGFLRYKGDVDISQFNFAGIGATGGNPGNSFPDVRTGIRAQIQHLKAYAVKGTNTTSFNYPCVDPRLNSWFTENYSGTAPYVEWLGINENPYGKGWATAVNYGYSIRKDYINKLLVM